MLCRQTRRRGVPAKAQQKRSYAKKPVPEPLRPAPVPAPNAAVRDNPNITKANNYYEFMGPTQGTWLRSWIGQEPKQFVDDEGNIWRRSYAENRDARWLSTLKPKYLDENHAWTGANLPTSVENTPSYFHPYIQAYLDVGRLPFPNIEVMMQWAENMVDPAHFNQFEEQLKSGNIDSAQVSRILGIPTISFFEKLRTAPSVDEYKAALNTFSSLNKKEKEHYLFEVTPRTPDEEAILQENYRKARIILEKNMPGYADARAQATNPNKWATTQWKENEDARRVYSKVFQLFERQVNEFEEHAKRWEATWDDLRRVTQDMAADTIRFMYLWNHLGIPIHAWYEAYPEIERLIEESSYDGSFDAIFPGVKVNEPLSRKWFAHNPIKLFRPEFEKAIAGIQQSTGLTPQEFFDARKDAAYPLPAIRSEADVAQDKLDRLLTKAGQDPEDATAAQRHLRKLEYDLNYRRAVERLATGGK